MKIPQDARPKGARAGSLRVALDPEQAFENSRPREHRFVPLDRGPFRIETERFDLGAFLVRIERSTSRNGLNAIPAAGTTVVIGQTKGDGDLRYLGRDFARTELAVAHGGQPWQGLLPRESEFISVTFASEMLRRASLDRGWPDREADLRGTNVLSETNGRRFLTEITRILQRVGLAPNALDEPATRKSIEEDVLDQLLCVLPGASAMRGKPRLSAPARRSALARAAEYALENLASAPGLSDLCRAAETSERTLQYAFREAYSVSPSQFIKRARLGRVRLDLLSPRGGGESVLNVATRWGFYDAGHFAGDYHRLFGELPSETRQRGGAPGTGA